MSLGFVEKLALKRQMFELGVERNFTI